MKIWIGHPLANQFFRHMVTAFHRADMLGAVATGFDGGPMIKRGGALLPAGLRRELERRRFPEPWNEQLRTRPVLEVARLISQRLGAKSLCKGADAMFGVDAVFRDFDRWMARSVHAYDAAYVYEDGALETFGRARASGITCVYDLPIAYWETLRRLIREEGERLPEWASTLGGGLSDPPSKLERKTRELELADIVVVPSGFVADSLPASAKTKRVVVSPFGSPAPLSDEVAEEARAARRDRARAGRPLRVLFAGSMGQRKGLADLMAAVRRARRADVELVVMGSLQQDFAFYQNECPGFIYEPGRPHPDVLKLMRSCDVFCLPSIVEGRALVMQEAMSQGLPLIITANTGGADLVTAGAFEANSLLRSETGFLVPIRAPERIAEAIAWCADHREAVVAMGEAARAKAAAYTWDAYGQKVVDALLSHRAS